MPLLRSEDVTKQYLMGDVTVVGLCGLNLSIEFVAIIISEAATIGPARRATRVNIVEAIKYE